MCMGIVLTWSYFGTPYSGPCIYAPVLGTVLQPSTYVSNVPRNLKDEPHFEAHGTE